MRRGSGRGSRSTFGRRNERVAIRGLEGGRAALPSAAGEAGRGKGTLRHAPALELAMALAIDVSGLNKHFGAKHVVKDFALQVREGEIFGFLGPNGSGKTTTIRMLCGLLKPDSGRGTCLGYDVLRETASIKREVGYMTQRFSLWEDLSIRENLDFVARMYGMRERRRAVDASLEALGLAPRADQLSGTLSGGWKQRLALAACMLHEPRLLLLDEPTAGVDPKARRDFWEEIHALAARGISVLVSTHYMDEAERCHRLAYIAYGALLATGTPDEIRRSQRLVTWAVSGPNLAALSRELAKRPGVAQVTAFGNTLHVTGTDPAALEAAIAPYRDDPQLSWEPVEPGLEDVFINLMSGASDNYG
jgi:ABC-2 type transport system ATP-binding protein